MHKIILHIPHSSVIIPIRDGFLVNDNLLEREILKLTDWYTDDLFYSKEDIIIKADFSRLFCDTERFADDIKEEMAQFGMGVAYEKTDSGNQLRKVTPELKKTILQNYYHKHHSSLNEAVKNQLNLYGKATILDCHSFSDIPFERDLNKQPNRPDFCIGTDSFHTPQKLIDISIEFFNDKKYSLGVNTPYSGSIVPLEYYQKNKNIQSIMLEVNRKLYLKPDSNEKSDNYIKVKNVIQDYIVEIKKYQNEI